MAHEFVVAGALPEFDGERLLADAKRICEAQIRFWHGDEEAAVRALRVHAQRVEDGHGGLEHRASTALISPRRDMPQLGKRDTSDGYVTLLGLISHEYFHTWNVKRLRPAEFARYDYTQENYTELLWFFEGFTSYYDDLFLLRAGLIDAPRYLKLVARAVNGVRQSPGQHVQSVAQASFDAWVKYYRGDENTPNATVSYYTKGSLVALAPRPDAARRRQGHARRRDARAVGRQRRRADRRGADRRGLAAGRRALVPQGARGLGARHRRPAVAVAARACRCRPGAGRAIPWRSAWACASARARSPASR